jgi:hypothetical protein
MKPMLGGLERAIGLCLFTNELRYPYWREQKGKALGQPYY